MKTSNLNLLKDEKVAARKVKQAQRKEARLAQKAIKKAAKKPAPNTPVVNCSLVGPRQVYLGFAQSPELKKLNEYESVCGGAITKRVMLFTSMPSDGTEATSLAINLSTRLKELSAFGISPLVIFEPVTKNGNINFVVFKTGGYDPVMDIYYSTLKSQGITDAMMGLWALFPESNIPEWGNVNPADISGAITKAAQLQKKHFPASKTSVVLDSKSYPNPNSWDGGGYTSLLPYVSGIPAGLIDSFGIQGFPWPDTQPDYNAANFVSPTLAKEAANSLGVKDIWINSGTFSRGKAWNGQRINLTPYQRQIILDDIISQGKKLQSSGFRVSLALFAEDKFNTSEKIDWSYWQTGKPDKSDSTNVFKTLTNSLKANNIDLWLYDSL